MDGESAKSCLACGTVGVRMSICKVCKDEFGEKNHYCSKSCQAADWKVHKEYHRNHQSRRTMNCQLTVSSFQQYPFDDDLFFGLMDNPEGPTNVLQLVSARDLPPHTETPNGTILLQFQKIEITSSLGYIEDIEIFDDLYTMKAVAKSTIHRDSVLRICGSESLDRLGETKKISFFAWLVTGGDFAKFQDGCSIAPQLHTMEPLPGAKDLPPKTDDQEYYVRQLTVGGPLWAVRDVPPLPSAHGTASVRAGAP